MQLTAKQQYLLLGGFALLFTILFGVASIMNMPEVYMRKTGVVGGYVDHDLLFRKYLICGLISLGMTVFYGILLLIESQAVVFEEAE
ncbi:hypothetical protein [Paenibacillus lutrae]|uniref:Uncharacterized protein n=1 Tax=Paenibacillus lutrae TaxID=2078573 RepID=A0A7X3FDY8_9BACL|nr:hypothetical protein [Paenibacillus lutrae]MVO97994.1 hypothetical protein [Paenibacillus lutrae]